MTARQKATHIYYTKGFFGLRQTFAIFFFFFFLHMIEIYGIFLRKCFKVLNKDFLSPKTLNDGFLVNFF